MIAGDQPTIFGMSVVAAVSSSSDGNMSFGRGDEAETLQNRINFLKKVGVHPEHTTLVRIAYENVEHFAKYYILTNEHKSEGMLRPDSSTMISDALVVTRPGHALFLPIADCVGVILYDTKRRILMVSHVGRHSAEIEGAKRSVDYLIAHFSTDPRDMSAWLSPAVGKATYPLHRMSNKGLHEVIVEQLHASGVQADNIEVSHIDTAEDKNYFSHSRFLEGGRPTDGRFAIVAAMTEQGEPAL